MAVEIPESAKRHWRIMDELEAQTDRGMAIIGAAYLEERLTEAIRSRFVSENEQADELLSYKGPLGTFGAKIDAAYAFGLIGEVTRRDLHLIRYIRNDFAHTVEPVSFNTDSIANRCREIQISATILMFGAKDFPSEPRDMYGTAMTIIYNLLWSEITQSDDPSPTAARFTP
jgi:DNA-binding MltR family transcriptional regulator